MNFSPAVESWRNLVHDYFGPFTDQALWVMQYESGGDPNAIGDSGAAIGLFQIQHTLPGRPSQMWLSNPTNNIAYAAQQLGGSTGNFSAWGQGTESLPPFDPTTGFGKFGALGSHPFPAELGGIAPTAATTQPSTPDTTGGFGKGVGFPPIPNPISPVLNALSSITGPIGDFFSAFKKTPEAWNKFLDSLKSAGSILKTIGETTVTILKWLTDWHNYFRLAFYLTGGLMIIGGMFIVVKGQNAAD